MRIALRGMLVLMMVGTPAIASVNRALFLDGDGDYVEVPNSDGLSFPEPISVEFWVQCDALPAVGEAFLIGRHTTPPRDQTFYASVTSSGALAFHVGFADVTLTVNGILCSSNEPQHVAYTYDGSTMRAYVNGSPAGSRAASAGISSTAGGTFGIGADIDFTNSPNQFFTGWLDEVRIWNRTLTPVEIQDNYQLTLGGSEPGLVGYWNFNDGTADDASDLENHGTFMGDATTVVWADPLVNCALYLDGDGDYVEVPDSDELSIADPISVGFWMQCDGLPAFGEDFLIGRHSTPPRDQTFYASVTADGDLTFHVGFSDVTLVSNVPCSLEAPQYVAFTYDGTTMRAYVNGKSAGSRLAFANIQSTVGGTFGIGADIDFSNSPNQFFSGWLDEIAVWDRALSQVEVRQAMRFGVDGAAPDVVGLWNFDDSTASDMSTNGNDGTLYGDAALVRWDLPPGPFLDLGIYPALYYPILSATNRKYQLQGRDTVLSLQWNPIGNPIVGTGDLMYGYEWGSGEDWLTSRAWEVTACTEDHSLEFDGVDDLALRGHDDLLNLTGGMTLEAWVKPTQPAFGGTLLAKAASPVVSSYRVELDGTGQVVFRIYDAGGASFVNLSSSASLPSNTWTHVAASYDGSVATVYLDGVLDQTQAVTGAVRVSAVSSFVLGSIFGTDPFAGRMDDVRVWDHARAGADIARDYSTQLLGTEPGLVAYWPLRSPGSQVVLDDAANGLDLTLGVSAVADTLDPLWSDDSFPPETDIVVLFEFGVPWFGLQWETLPVEAYTVEACSGSLDGPWLPVASGLQGTGSLGEFIASPEDAAAGSSGCRSFRVSATPSAP